ncbi:MAG: carboxypeptidase-like regulatory domain-containing protein [Myxococcales bacterium]
MHIRSVVAMAAACVVALAACADQGAGNGAAREDDGAGLFGVGGSGQDDAKAGLAEWEHVEWGFVAGEVVGPNGRAMQNVLVELWTPDELLMSATSDPKGRFELHQIPAGSYSVRLVGPNGEAVHVPGTKDVHVGVNKESTLKFAPIPSP